MPKVINENVRAVVDFVSTRQPNEVKLALEAAIREKISNRLEEYKKVVAGRLVGQEKEREEDEPSHTRNR